ncbi:hypothetical protein SUDANB145_00556 [Streptomyces sp. enrichment culture]
MLRLGTVVSADLPDVEAEVDAAGDGDRLRDEAGSTRTPFGPSTAVAWARAAPTPANSKATSMPRPAVASRTASAKSPAIGSSAWSAPKRRARSRAEGSGSAAMTGAAPTRRASRMPWALRPQAPQMPTACAGRTAQVSTIAAYGVETESGVIAGLPGRTAGGPGWGAGCPPGRGRTGPRPHRRPLPGQGLAAEHVAQTVSAVAARQPGLEHDPPAGSPVALHLGADGVDDAGHLVAGRDGDGVLDGADGVEGAQSSVRRRKRRPTRSWPHGVHGARPLWAATRPMPSGS